MSNAKRRHRRRWRAAAMARRRPPRKPFHHFIQALDFQGLTVIRDTTLPFDRVNPKTKRKETVHAFQVEWGVMFVSPEAYRKLETEFPNVGHTLYSPRPPSFSLPLPSYWPPAPLPPFRWEVPPPTRPLFYVRSE